MPHVPRTTVVHSGFNLDGRFGHLGIGDLHIAEHFSRRGDKRIPRDLEKFSNEAIRQLGIEPLMKIDEVKQVPLSEFRTIRRSRITLDRRYFEQSPPTSVLDLEDPHREMTRYIHPIPTETVQKGGRFLFGKGRFAGAEAFIFGKGGANFKKKWVEVWQQNRMDARMPRIGMYTLYAGDKYLKFNAEVITEQVISVPEEAIKEAQLQLDMKESREVKISFTEINSEDVHVITERDRFDRPLVFIHQFQRADTTFFREEFFRDMTLVYEGNLKQDENDVTAKQQDSQSLSIQGSGLKVAEIHTENQMIEFRLVKIVHHEEFDEFPLIWFLNEPDADFYGKSVYQGLHGKFDFLNAIFTRSLHAIENQATPLLWLAGVAESTGHDVHTADSIWTFADPNAKLNVLQWDGTPKAVFEFIDRIERQIAKKIGVPRSGDLETLTTVSGEALQFANTDIIDTTRERRLYFEEGFRRMVRLVRIALGIKNPIEESMEMKWGPVFPDNPDQKAAHLLVLHKAKLLKGRRVIEEDPFLPFFKKEELMREAEELEEVESSFRQANLDVQAKRVTDRGTGNSKERGEQKEKKNKEKKQTKTDQ